MLPAEKQVFMRKVMSIKPRIDEFENGPSTAVKALLSIWQKNHFPLLCDKENFDDFNLSTDSAFIGLSSWLTDRPFLESAFWLSSAYAVWVGNDARSEKSLYFTPPVLADRLIDNLISQGASLKDDVWVDPACGGGAFLAPVAIRMIDAMSQEDLAPAQIIERITTNLRGNDIDATLAFLSTQFVLMALYKYIVLSNIKPKIEVSTGNGLRPTLWGGQKADVILCNPPYRKMKSIEVRDYVDEYSEIIEGQPNIYGLFIRQCLNIGRDHSLIGLLTPTSYLSGKYFSKLRKLILKEATVRQLDLVDDREGVFIGVSQGAAISLYQRGQTSRARNDTAIYALSITGAFTEVGKCTLTLNTDAWPIPRRKGDQEIVQRAAGSPYRLSDFGYSARVGTYVDYRDKRRTYLKKPQSKKTLVFPLIWSSDITTDGKFHHGRTSKQDGHHVFIDMERNDRPGIVRRPVIALQRVTSPDQPRRLVCAAVDSEFINRFNGIVGENHVIFIEQTSEEAAFSADLFAKVLSSEPVDRLFRSISGAVNVSVSELNQLPLPNPAILSKFLEHGYSVNEAVIESFKQSRSI